MRSRRHLHLALLTAATLLGACADAEDPAIGALEAAQISANNLWWQDLAAVAGDAQTLMASTFKQSATTARMYDTAAGKSVLIYLAKCGLPRGTSVTITNSAGVSRPFDGWLGLVPGWSVGPPTRSQAYWLAGCLALHMNALHTPVEISIRGNHAAYAVQQAERAAFQYQEGAFWGNPEIQLYACPGTNLLAQCGPSAPSPAPTARSRSPTPARTCAPATMASAGGTAREGRASTLRSARPI
jgi:hypothetical protein